MTYALLGLAFVLLVVFSIFVTKTWHWINSLFLILTFLVGIGAAVATSEVYQKRTTDMKRYVAAKKKAETTQAEARLAVFGPEDINYGPDSLRGRTEALNRELTGRGRVWENGEVAAKGNNRVFKFKVSRPVEDGGDGAMQDVLLNAFVDSPVGPDGVPYPTKYIGTLVVESETPDSVELAPVFLADKAEYATPSSSWTLFEKMPSDRNDAFHRVVGTNPKDEDFDISAYRKTLETDYMPASMFGINADGTEVLSADSPAYEKIIDRYAFDGLKLGQIEDWLESNAATRKNSRFEPEPEAVFVEYKFNKKSNRNYQVDANGNLETDGLFTPLGHAVRTDLHVGGEGSLAFAKNDTIYVDQLNADGYQRADGTVVQPFPQTEDVTEVSRLYVRQNRDYPYILDGLERQTARLDEETKRVTKDNQEQDIIITNAQAQINERDEIIVKLQKDQEFLTRDFDSIKVVLEKRQAQWSEMQKRLATLEKQVADQHAELQKAGKVTNTSTKK